ncbi:MAG: ComF family protein [Bacteroidales bacterium]|nr:ComF family protein [Bacteroidales bacterium]
MNTVFYIIKSVFFTLFPRTCIFCNKILDVDEHRICKRCNKLYPYPVIDKPGVFFAPLYPYTSRICIMGRYTYIKKALLEFKFRENIAKGNILGKMLSDKLMLTDWAKDIDIIVPVPLHKKQLKKRTYNQCRIIADIIGKKLNKPVIEHNLYKVNITKNQHRIGYSSRLDNPENNYNVKNTALFADKKILLVDDVITTCTTLTECCKALKQCPNIEISICALASNRRHI